MDVKDIMTENPATSRPDTSLREVARLFVDHDCGAIPVIDDTGRPVGILTDRDVVVRSLAEGKNPMDLRARDCMTPGTVTVTPDTSVGDLLDLMRDHQVRRIPVVDESGRCCGIVSQADVALEAGDRKAGNVVKEVSKPGEGTFAHH